MTTFQQVWTWGRIHSLFDSIRDFQWRWWHLTMWAWRGRESTTGGRYSTNKGWELERPGNSCSVLLMLPGPWGATTAASP